MKRILLLDIENQTKKLKELTSLLAEYSQVILVYANTHLTVALDELNVLSKAIQEERLLLIKMPKVGLNSADFGLTFIAGRLSATLQQGDSVDVMSNDKQMSYAVDLLQQLGIDSNQLKENVPLVKIVQEKDLLESKPERYEGNGMTHEYIVVRPHLLRLQQYCQYLAKIKNNRPARQESLENSLKSVLKLEQDAQIKVMFNLLKKHKLIMLDNKKVTYVDAAIHFWNKLA